MNGNELIGVQLKPMSLGTKTTMKVRGKEMDAVQTADGTVGVRISGTEIIKIDGPARIRAAYTVECPDTFKFTEENANKLAKTVLLLNDFENEFMYGHNIYTLEVILVCYGVSKTIRFPMQVTQNTDKP